MAIKSDNGPSSAEAQHEEGLASGPAPPSYAAVTAGQSSTAQPTYPQIVPYPTTTSHNTHLRTPGSLEQGIYDAQAHPFAHGGSGDWTPPQTEQEARARTRKRFLVACLWGFGIYMLIGLLLGGGYEDSSSTSNRRDRNRHRQPTSDRPSNPGERVDPAHPSRTWKHVDRTSTMVEFAMPSGSAQTHGGELMDVTEGRQASSKGDNLDVQQVRGILEAIEAARL